MSDEPATQALSSEHGGEQPAVTEGPVLLHIWTVDPDQEGVAVHRLQEMLGEVRSDSGFVSGRLLESGDGYSVAVIIEMRTVEDRRRLERLPAVSDTLSHLEGAINLDARLYHEIGAYSG